MPELTALSFLTCSFSVLQIQINCCVIPVSSSYPKHKFWLAHQHTFDQYALFRNLLPRSLAPRLPLPILGGTHSHRRCYSMYRAYSTIRCPMRVTPQRHGRPHVYLSESSTCSHWSSPKLARLGAARRVGGGASVWSAHLY